MEKAHEVILTDRKELHLTGILAVEISNEQQIVLQTSMGTLYIDGDKLKILYLNPEKSEAAVNGNINGMEYRKQRTKKFLKLNSLLRRLEK